MLKVVAKLPSTVWLLGLVSLFNDAASELVYPPVPFHPASALMAGPRALGLIDGFVLNGCFHGYGLAGMSRTGRSVGRL
jgi:hypothetical protein